MKKTDWLLILVVLLVATSIRIYYEPNIFKLEGMKSFYSDSKNYTYLYDVDPYHYYNMVNVNHWDNFLSFFAYHWNNLLNIFKDISLMGSMNLIPLIFLNLLLITLYLYVESGTGSSFVAFFASLFLAINRKFFYNSIIADTNMLNHFFIILLFLVVYTISKKGKEVSIVSIGHVFPKSYYGVLIYLLGVIFFSWVWPSYWIIVFMTFFIISVYILFEMVVKQKRWKYLLILGVILLLSFVLIYQYLPKLNQYISGDQATNEMERAASTDEISIILMNDWYQKLLNLPLLPTLSLLFLISFLFLKAWKTGDFFYYMIFSWLIFWLIPSYLSARFIYFLVIPYCIGWALIFKEMAEWSKLHSQIGYTILLLLGVIGIILSNNYSEMKIRKGLFVNDATVNVMDYIKDNYDTNTTLIAWWDEGYPFEALSGRHVYWKGVYTKYQADWVSTIYKTSNESEAFKQAKDLCDKHKCLFILSLQAIEKMNLTSESMVYKFLNNQTENFTYVYSRYGISPQGVFECLSVYEAR